MLRSPLSSGRRPGLLLLPVALLAVLPGCTSLANPVVRSDFYETLYRGQQAVQGDAAAYDRLGELQDQWRSRGRQGSVYKLTPWDRAGRDNAAAVAEGLGPVMAGRDAVLSQRELTEVMLNAVKDIDSEYDAILDMLLEDDAPAAELATIADQKFLVRRIANSITLMTQVDMTDAAVAADGFGRDVARLQALLSASLNGDEVLGIEPPENPEVEASLAQIDELFNGYIADSSEDVLENVVTQYELWQALQQLAALAPAAAAAVPDDTAGADDAAGDDAAGDDAAGDADAAAEDLPADEAGLDAAVDGEFVDDEAGADEAF